MVAVIDFIVAVNSLALLLATLLLEVLGDSSDVFLLLLVRVLGLGSERAEAILCLLVHI